MTALTFKENELHNRLIVAEFNLEQVEEELRRLREENEALRARLAQPEPEPLAWLYDFYGPDDPTEIIKDWTASSLAEVKRCGGVNLRPLYTAPPQREWQGLTENEIKHLWYEACQTNLELTSQLIVHLARNIEAKLKENNT
jgi:hypothetical protein